MIVIGGGGLYRPFPNSEEPLSPEGWTSTTDDGFIPLQAPGGEHLTLDATACSIILTAATMVLLLTIPAGNQQITVTAPTATLAAATTLATGSNTIQVTASAQSQLVATSLATGNQAITVTAPVTTQDISTQLAAGATSALVSAPDPTLVTGGGGDVTLSMGTPTVLVVVPVSVRQDTFILDLDTRYLVRPRPPVRKVKGPNV